MSKDDTLSFKKADGPVHVDDDQILATQDHLPQNLVLSQYDDTYLAGHILEVHGGKGNDTIDADEPSAIIYGDAGNDQLFSGQNGGVTAFGGNGNDTLRAIDMTGGAGHDTFILDYYFETAGGVGGDQGATIHDFKPGTDHLIFTGFEGASLTHEGDIWTVQSPDPDYQNAVGDPNASYSVSFHIVGVTELSPADYSFSDIFT